MDLRYAFSLLSRKFFLLRNDWKLVEEGWIWFGERETAEETDISKYLICLIKGIWFLNVDSCFLHPWNLIIREYIIIIIYILIFIRSAGRFDELDVTQAMKFHHFSNSRVLNWIINLDGWFSGDQGLPANFFMLTQSCSSMLSYIWFNGVLLFNQEGEKLKGLTRLKQCKRRVSRHRDREFWVSLYWCSCNNS